jgi:surfeit locus 1 family protein
VALPQSTGMKRPKAIARLALLGGLAVAFIGFVALGVWQLERRVWKLDLIQRVESRSHASPAAAPGPAQWRSISAVRDEYRHIEVSGRYLPDADTRVQAVTAIGAGYWLLTPLQRRDGSLVLINRGFVPPDWAPEPTQASAAAPEIRVTGLLRLTEPDGGFLRRNAPAEKRWYSRDVQAIAVAHGLRRVAPYFIDADAGVDGVGRDAAGTRPDGPVGGLTVVRFRNQHLQYALTWFALALMVAAGVWRVLREDRRRIHSYTRSADAGRNGSRHD